MDLHFVMAVLSCWRMVELVANDSIFEWFREKFPKLGGCPRCISVWCGGIAVLLYVYIPWANWPFAFSMMYMLESAILNRVLRRARNG